jgi:myo-inositol-1(or 4)-monophosphatase
MNISRDKFHEVLQKSCFQAGEIILKSFGTNKKIKSKGDNNWVTETDLKAENAIIKCIKKYFPESSFLAEESGRSKNQSDLHWIIDPIDGTNNYIHNYPFFCVSIALSIGGVLSCASIFDPLKKEFFFAEKNKGSFLNERKISVTKLDKLSKSLLCTGFITSNKKHTDINIRNFKNLTHSCRSIRRDGSAALDLAYVACGRLDAFWELGLNAWDTAAGILLVKEAGGTVTQINGKDYSIYDESLLASNSYIHKDLMKKLQYK